MTLVGGDDRGDDRQPEPGATASSASRSKLSSIALWKLVPGHFAERHGLIVIIALGESIVAIGAGASGALDFGIGTVAVLGVGLAAALWWTYFDLVALISAKRLGAAETGRVQTSSPAPPTPSSTWRWSPASSSSPSG